MGRNHDRVGPGRDVRRANRGPLFGGAPQPRGLDRAGRGGVVPVGDRARVHRSAVAGRFLRGRTGLCLLQRPLRRHGRPGDQARRILHHACDHGQAAQPLLRIPRHVLAGVRNPGHRQRTEHPRNRDGKPRKPARDDAHHGHRHVAGRHDGLCHQPGARPASACGPQHPAHQGEGHERVGLQLGARGGAVLGALAAGAIYGCIYICS